MYLDRTYRPRRRRWSWLEFWPLYLLAIIAIVLYEQQPAWLAGRTPTPTPVPTRAAIAFLADAQRALDAVRYTEAMAAYQHVLRLEPNNVDALIALSELALIFRELEDAQRYAERAVAAAPEDVHALSTLARALNWLEDNNRAVDYAFDALDLAPEDPTTLAVLAEIYTDEGNWSQAETYLNQALANDPTNVTALRNRSYFYERQRDYENAVTALQAAIAVAPNRFDLYIELGRQYRVGLADYTKANEAYAQAVAVYEAPITLDAQGDGLYNAGDHPQAVRVLRKAVELDPDYGPALVHYGMALYARRNYEDAALYLDQGLRILGDRARIEHFYTAGLAFINKEPRECDKAIPWLEQALLLDAEAPAALQGLRACDQPVPTPTPVGLAIPFREGSA
jgi:tetratricopeptide (TPR) repeat protein